MSESGKKQQTFQLALKGLQKLELEDEELKKKLCLNCLRNKITSKKKKRTCVLTRDRKHDQGDLNQKELPEMKTVVIEGKRSSVIWL